MAVRLNTVHREFLTGSIRPLPAVDAVHREVLQGSRLGRNIIAPVALVHREFLIKTPPLHTEMVHREYLILQTEPDVIRGQVLQNFEQVAQHGDFPAMADVFSSESVVQNVEQVTQQSDPMPFVWSQTRAAQALTLVVQSRPIVTQSITRAAQVRGLIIQQFAYTIPDELWSTTVAPQVVMLVVQSIDIPYTPVSGELLRQNMLAVVQQTPGMEIWRSPAYAGQLMMRVVQKRTSEPFPRSLIRVPQQMSQVTHKRSAEPFPQSDVAVGQSLSQVTQATVMPEYQGVDHAAQTRELVTQATVMPAPVGMIRTTQVIAELVTALPLILPISRMYLRQMVARVTAHADYLAPENLLARTAAAQVRHQAVQAADYPSASAPSVTVYAQALTVFNQKADPSWYISPGIIYERSKVVIDAQLHELAAQSSPLSLPISAEVDKQLQMLVVANLPLPTPEQMANSGIFATQLSEAVALVAKYPSTDEPASDIITGQVLQHTALVAEYPDAFLPTNFALVDQLHQQVMLAEEFADPGTLHAPINVSHISEQLAAISGYPDPDTLHSPVGASQIALQLSVPAVYPDKDAILSFSKISQLTQQAAFMATYPNKDLPQSRLRVNQVRHHVARRDLTMYQLPVPPRRHRVRIVCHFVY